ncbi:Survival factor-like protein [Hapsidospora chrysogenum ATCC 11550]|uniref:Survival factor-like protein n=1 Tax=Hapsidospora chrysogenum (strain ATCC 11550 / CBS 779.69 / DSM 880 / IAM 14645 / JCM 23072 / IMI 49137) TaxID=857340 RepID=A0A086STI2_HAPC1|nr:Survival factor-like protein [Hapsidospora chrysogenum ATCC 11550]
MVPLHVGDEVDRNTYSELTRDDLKWKEMDSTNVETETFYFVSDEGRIAMAQVIYSNVAGIRITGQFNVKIFSRDSSQAHLWCSTPLSNIEFSQDHFSFYADDCALELSEDGTYYTIKSMNDERAIVNLKVTRTAPGFQGGKTGTTLFGTDLQNPWGTMRHAFWPRCVSEGTITTKDGPVDFKGRALYAYAIQGMKPHHAAARWNFVDFQGPNYSAVMMEFTTPPSYGSTVVNVGGLAKDGAIVTAGCANTATHTAVKQDTDNDWPEPSGVRFVWNGKDKDGKPVEAVIEGPLGDRVDRVDVMAEVPGFVKTIVASAAGTKPYIYQYTPKVTMKLKIGDEEILEEGQVFSEATFISE